MVIPRRQRPILLAAVCACSLLSCEGDVRPFLESVEFEDLQLTTIAIRPPANSQDTIFLNHGEQVQLRLIGTNADGDEVSVPVADRRWRVEPEGIVSITSNGWVTGLANGSASVDVTLADLAATKLDINVSDAVLEEIAEIDGSSDPEGAESDQLLPCVGVSFSAIGRYSDMSTRTLRDVVWTIDEAAMAAGAELFAADGEPQGSRTLVGRNDGAITLTVEVPVVDEGMMIPRLSRTVGVAVSALTDLSISPDDVSVNVRNSINLAAIGTFNQPAAGTEMPITDGVEWSIERGDQAIDLGVLGNQPGRVSGVVSGTATVRASCGATLADATVLVRNPTGALSFDQSGSLTIDLADGVFQLNVSTGSVFNDSLIVNDSAEWSSSNTLILTVNNDDNKGEITPRATGTATVTASFDGRSEEITVTVR